MRSAAGHSRAWLTTTLKAFDRESALTQLGSLAKGAAHSGFQSTAATQLRAWEKQLDYLQTAAEELQEELPASADWTLLLEYEIPRRQRRIDAVLLTEQIVFVLEFKVDAESFNRADIWQTEDYSLDLRDFHKASHHRTIVPILIATKGQSHALLEDGTLAVHRVGATGLVEVILSESKAKPASTLPPIDPTEWDRAPYSPTPTIVEATQQLFAKHSVAGLSHSYADNLDTTVKEIQAACASAQAKSERVVCFVTGVPGAGKTLAGLAAVHAGASSSGPELGAYLSGNGPLVKVLREAIARDASSKPGTTKRDATHRARTLIQNVHQFVEEYGVKHTDLRPAEHIIVFDEAQRAWHQRKLEKRHADIGTSEPGLMLDAMSRVPDWCVLVALVGGGQEIHSGEAGLGEWGSALGSSTHQWRILASPEVMKGGDSVAFHRLFDTEVPHNVTVTESSAMHLSVSVRTPRARHLAEWVNAVLTLDTKRAKESLSKIDGFRIGLTRDLDTARAWLRDAARNEQRPGLLASSGSLRHRAYGLEMSPDFHRGYPIEHWFLGPPEDVRSSHSLEVALTEFECQGLEIDYVGLCWGGDFTVNEAGDGWDMRAFKGNRWLGVKADDARGYLLNKYRVLLTRAREGMVIWVPPGESSDPTREPDKFDRTAAVLLASGLEEVT